MLFSTRYLKHKLHRHIRTSRWKACDLKHKLSTMDLHSFRVLTQDYEYFVTWKLVVSFEAKTVQFISKWIKLNLDSFHSKALRAFETFFDIFAKVYRAKSSSVLLKCLHAPSYFQVDSGNFEVLLGAKGRFDAYVFIYRYFYWQERRLK